MARAVQGAQKKSPRNGAKSDPQTRSQVGIEMPRIPGAISRTKDGFSRCEYGVDHGAPKAAQWKCARAPRGGTAQSAAMATARGVARPESSHPAPMIAAAGSEGYSQSTATPEKNPTDAGPHRRSGPGQNAARYAEPRQNAA